MHSFITVEGGEFTGKTSVAVPALASVLQDTGNQVLVSREPGGSPAGEVIRSRIFQRLEAGAPPIELARLFNQARQIHLDEVILPFVAQHPDGMVILDRYVDSTLVYQGLEAGVEIEELLQLHEAYTQNTFPDLTIILAFPPERFDLALKLRRVAQALDTSRDSTSWDSSKVETHRARQESYLSLANLYESFGISRTFAAVDASRHPYDTIEGSIRATALHLPHLNEGDCLIESFQRLRDAGQWEHMNEVWQNLRRFDPELQHGNHQAMRR